MPDSARRDESQPIGEAGSLFDTDEIRPIQVPPSPSPSPAALKPVPADGGYELEGYSEPEVEEPPRPVAIPSPPVERPNPAAPRPKARAKPAEEIDSTEFATEVSGVDPTWSRLGEWGRDLVRVGAVGLGTLFLAWCFGLGTPGLLVFLLGGAATALLSYPLLITVERPVRITPEQAVGDFFAAASHHFPHYRRMWLLLSDVGRHRFASFEDFRDQWKGQVAGWRQASGGGSYTPLKFEVDAFRADKSTGKETSRADYTINVHLRDREDVGPIASFRMAHGLVKGPDRMWYLNAGALESGPK